MFGFDWFRLGDIDKMLERSERIEKYYLDKVLEYLKFTSEKK